MNQTEQEKMSVLPKQDTLADRSGLLVEDFLVIKDVSTQKILVAQRNRRG